MSRAGLSYVCSPECRGKLYTRARESKPAPKVDALEVEMRKQIRQRDGHRCRWCGQSRTLHVHHIVLRSQGGPNEPWNLITLCASCHERAHSDVGHWQPVLLETVARTTKQRMTVAQVDRWEGDRLREEAGAHASQAARARHPSKRSVT